MARMIIFNGAALESIAPVKIEDIRVGPIIQAPVARDRPLPLFGRMKGHARSGSRLP